jgi:phosphatidylinositol-3-phosphatase
MRRRRFSPTAARAIGAVAVAGCLAVAAAIAPAAGGAGALDGVPAFGHVFLIVGENTDYSHVTPVNMPYLTGSVRPHAAWLERYYSATHWSQANYVAMVTGQFTRCEQQDGGVSCHQNIDNLYHRMDVAGLSWKVWLEAGSAKCDTGSGGSCSSNVACPLSGFYTTGNPPILFDDIEGPNGVWSATTPSPECLANDVPAGTPSAGMSAFNADLASGKVAAFNTVIPNGCDDGESNCKPVNNKYTQFDDFLATEVPLIEASPAFKQGGVIIITYDESERADGQDPPLGAGGHTVCAVISPMVVPGDYGTVTYLYSMLRTLQDGFGVVAPGYLGAANQVSPLPVSWN